MLQCSTVVASMMKKEGLILLMLLENPARDLANVGFGPPAGQQDVRSRRTATIPSNPNSNYSHMHMRGSVYKYNVNPWANWER